MQSADPTFFLNKTYGPEQVNEAVTYVYSLLGYDCITYNDQTASSLFENPSPFGETSVHVREITIGSCVIPRKFIVTANFEIAGKLDALISADPMQTLPVVFVIIVGVQIRWRRDY